MHLEPERSLSNSEKSK